MTVVPASVPERPPHAEVAPFVRLRYHLVLAVDIEGYSRRSTRQQVQAQADLLDAIESAAETAGLDRSRWFQQVGGDGLLAVLPQDTDAVTVVDVFTQALERALALLERGAAPDRRLRVRLALHHGPLATGRSPLLGPAGPAPVVVRRLLDSAAPRRYLRRHPDRNVALIVSAEIFRDVVNSGLCALPPAFFQHVRTTVKGVQYNGRLYVPDRAEAAEWLM